MRGLVAAAAPILLILSPFSEARGDLWLEATDSTIGGTAEWSNKVELADVDGDGLVDIIFANGGGYSSAGEPQVNRVFLNQGPGMPFLEATSQVFGDSGDLARAIKVVDLTGDGVNDIIVATTFQTRSRLFLGLGGGEFLEVTETHTPPELRSFGDVEVGDVDGDGDLDLVFADWGPGSPSSNAGGVTRIWINNGKGAFSDATAQRMSSTYVRWSWDLELVDVDNDFDLDIMVSCKSCTGSHLFINDGEGYFDPQSDWLPDTSNNYEFAPMDIDGDGDIDVVTINDGGGLKESVFRNDGTGLFEDATAELWPEAANVGADDNVIEWLDVDSDGDADFVIGSLSGADRLLENDGDGMLSLTDTGVFAGSTTPGTLGMAFADLDGDMKLDVVMSQGETASPDVVFLGDEIAPDSAGPVIGEPRVQLVDGVGVDFWVRIHDHKSPTRPTDWGEVTVSWALGSTEVKQDLSWYGEYLWRARVVPPHDGDLVWILCARDAAGNTVCGDYQTTTVSGFGEPLSPVDEEPEAGPEVGPEDSLDHGAEGVGADAGTDVLAPDVGVDSSAEATAEPGVDSGPPPPPPDEGCSTAPPANGTLPLALALLLALLTVTRMRRLVPKQAVIGQRSEGDGRDSKAAEGRRCPASSTLG